MEECMGLSFGKSRDRRLGGNLEFFHFHVSDPRGRFLLAEKFFSRPKPKLCLLLRVCDPMIHSLYGRDHRKWIFLIIQLWHVMNHVRCDKVFSAGPDVTPHLSDSQVGFNGTGLWLKARF